MFEVGKKYTIWCMEDSEDGLVTTEYPDCTVLEAAHPLIKIDQNGEISVFNTASLSFVEARAAA
jgi:hypothetical protein